MMMLDINKQKMWYALQEGEVPIYETNENGDIIYYEDSDGNKIPIETGETELGYDKPTPFFGNIAFSSGEVDNLPFGTDISSYDATLVMNKDELPIDENSLLWFESEPQYKDVDKTIVDAFSADFHISGIVPSLNQIRYILKRITK